MFILIPAYLEICSDCRLHGHFKFADGSVSPEFCSKEEARDELLSRFERGGISREEFVFLGDEIRKTRMSEEEGDASLLVQLTCASINSEAEWDGEKVWPPSQSRHVH